MTRARWILPLLTVLQLTLAFARVDDCRAGEVSPAAVGWGNLLVPGLGASLRGEPARGLIEATSEIGLYYGGTFGVREGNFTIDGSVSLPTTPPLYAPLTGQIMQEVGLKIHFYNTFYNYQQAALAAAGTDREKNNPQPLYLGSWDDVLLAPFKWKNLSSPWVYPLILVSSAYLALDYHFSSVQRLGFSARPGEEALYGLAQAGFLPIGSSFGEEALFRGFIQREARLYTGSVPLSLLWQSAMFTLIHPAGLRITAFTSGVYFGLMTNHYDGNIEPAIAAHFWVNVVNGLVAYFIFRRIQGKDTPWGPPLTAQVQIPF